MTVVFNCLTNGNRLKQRVYYLLFTDRITRFIQGNNKPNVFVWHELVRAVH